MHITKSKKTLDLIEMKSRILVIIVGMYCYWYSVTIWNGESDRIVAMSEPFLNRFHRNIVCKQKAGTRMTQIMETKMSQPCFGNDIVKTTCHIIR